MAILPQQLMVRQRMWWFCCARDLFMKWEEVGGGTCWGLEGERRLGGEERWSWRETIVERGVTFFYKKK